jgi:PhnB protein
MPAINPYLTFSGNCEEVFNFYKAGFGNDFQSMIRFKDMPIEGHPMPEGAGDKIMHVSLPIGEGTILMGSDSPEGFGPPITPGNNFSISINVDSESEANKIFSALSAGGKVNMPLGKAPWGAYFGMFTDKFGVNWMVNHDYNKN